MVTEGRLSEGPESSRGPERPSKICRGAPLQICPSLQRRGDRPREGQGLVKQGCAVSAGQSQCPASVKPSEGPWQTLARKNRWFPRILLWGQWLQPAGALSFTAPRLLASWASLQPG